MEPFADLEFEEDFYTAQVPDPTVISIDTTSVNFRLDDISNFFTLSFTYKFYLNVVLNIVTVHRNFISRSGTYKS
jgi:hypothetical protein